jgi:hypothetical protein
VIVFTSSLVSSVQFFVYTFEKDNWRGKTFKYHVADYHSAGRMEMNPRGIPPWVDGQTLSRYNYIAGEFGDEIAMAHSAYHLYTCPADKKTIQDKTILTIVNRNGENRREFVIPKNEFKPFPKKRCPSLLPCFCVCE